MVLTGADDILPLFVYVLCHSDVIYPEAEASYIEMLLDSSLLLGEAGYYLTTFSGAAIAIRTWQMNAPSKSTPKSPPNVHTLHGHAAGASDV